MSNFSKNIKILIIILVRKLNRIIPDKIYLSLLYRLYIGKWMNWKSPKGINEKIQWLKIYDRNPKYTQWVDKFEAKKLAAGIIGEEFIIPTIGVYNSFDEINFDVLPERFVLKCTHDSGGLVICKDKDKLDLSSARKRIERSLKNNYYYSSREWPYKNVKPRIIAEQYMEEKNNNGDLRDYKFFCYDGVPKVLFICSERGVPGEKMKLNFFDMDFNPLPITNVNPMSEKIITKPQGFEIMKEIAAKLSKGIPHVRVDLYEINGKVYFGEMTFHSAGGFDIFKPDEWDLRLGSWIDLKKAYEYYK